MCIKLLFLKYYLRRLEELEDFDELLDDDLDEELEDVLEEELLLVEVRGVDELLLGDVVRGDVVRGVVVVLGEVVLGLTSLLSLGVVDVLGFVFPSLLVVRGVTVPLFLGVVVRGLTVPFSLGVVVLGRILLLSLGAIVLGFTISPLPLIMD